MALGNWDHISFNEKLQSIEGIFRTKAGVEVELYKNWLYIHDVKSWSRKGEFMKPIVMQISHGGLVYKDLHILARCFRTRNAIYFAAWTENYPEKGDNIVKGMIGIGCLTSDEGIIKDQLEVLEEHLFMWNKEYDEAAGDLPKEFLQKKLSIKGQYNQGEKFINTALATGYVGEKVGKTPLPKFKVHR